MARGGARPGAGRKRGSTNQKSREIAEKALASGLTPLEYMLDLMRQPAPETEDVMAKVRHSEMRFEAAKAAAPYVHPRLNAVEHYGKDGGPIEVHKVERVIVKP
jgi:hypothetical protein